MMSLDRAGLEGFVANNAVTLLATSSKTGSVLYGQYISEPAIAVAAFL